MSNTPRNTITRASFRRGGRLLAGLCVLGLVATAPATSWGRGGQAIAPTTRPEQEGGTTPPPPSATAADEEDAGSRSAPPPPEPRARASLLREGSQLLRAVGRIRIDTRTGLTTLVVASADGRMPPHELRLLPCMHLGELDRMIQAAPGHDLVFEISGQVLVYRDHNYLMMSHPPLMIGYEPVERVEETAEEESPPPGGSGEGSEAGAGTESGESGGSGESEGSAGGGDSVEEIIRDLQHAVGPVARRPGTIAPTSPIDEGRQSAGDLLVREGTVLLSRRGTIHRTSRGAFVFVFDADAEGLADPPMSLLPCLLLQRLERQAQAAGERAAVLISGHVYVYQGENYLLPSVYIVPHERTTLVP